MDAKMTELKISYSMGIKVNIGNYENVDVYVSEAETWDVNGLNEEEILKHEETRYKYLKELISVRAVQDAIETKGSK